MQTKILNGCTYLFIEPIWDTEPLYIERHCLGTYVCFEPGNKYQLIKDGEWEIVGKANQLIESDWEKIVIEPDYYDMYRDYKHPVSFASYNLSNAKESGYSLIRSLNMQPETTLILKKHIIK